MTLKALLDLHARRLKLTSGKEATLRSVATTSRALLAHFGPDFPVRSLTVDAWLEYMESRSDLAPASLRLQGSTLLAAMRGAELETIPRLPLPSVPTPEPVCLSDEEVARLFHAAPRYPRPVIAAGLYLGLRIGETIALRVRDVDVASSVVRIKPRPGWSPKSRRARAIPLSRKAREHIEPLCIGRDGAESLFRSPKTGRAWSAVGLTLALKRTFALAGIDPERAGSHKLRSTFVSRLLIRGVSVATGSKLCGHASAAVTLRSYANAGDEETARDAVELV
ncbi:MAG TPA: site-specific integrase [Myxococcota bacterium]|nr:site-specific integrase [Myxococcota bacterium]